MAGGGSVAAALAGPDAHLATLISAGERVGRLTDVVAAAADLEERLSEAARRIRAALAYPLLVAVVATGVVWITMATVVPQMAASLESLGGELPALTRGVLVVADVVAGRSALVVAAGAAAALVLRRRRASAAAPAGPIGWIPGRLGRDLEVAVVLRVAATLLEHGVPLLEALEVAARGATRGRVVAALGSMVATVRSGARLADDAGLGAVLAPPDRAVIAIGEDRGLLAPQFRRVAERRLADVERRLDRLAALAEPALVLVVGAVVGAVVAGLYLPSFRVLELL